MAKGKVIRNPAPILLKHIQGIKNNVKYDASTRVLCPDCGTNVHVGTAGPDGLQQHQGMGPCRDARQKKEEKKKTRKLFDFGWKKRDEIPTNTPSAAESSSSKSRLPEPVPVVVLPLVQSASESERRESEPQVIERKGCKLGWKLIGELKAAAENMGPEIPVAKPDDEISGFGRARAEAECMGVADDEIWETVNPGLDRFLGFGKSSDEVRSVIRRGERGVESFCQYLTYLVEEKGVKGSLLEGKITLLVDAIKDLYGLFLSGELVILTKTQT